MERLSLLHIFFRLCRPVGIFINHINWRFGRRFCCTSEEIEPVKDYLKPGAVILTHRKYELSTFFIPGYWTHSAFVISSEFIVEATGKGVCINTIGSFLSTVDDFIVLHPRFCLQDIMEKAGKQALTLVGYPYSFDFRNSDKMFYCSALICWVYIKTIIGRDNPLKIPSLFKKFLNGNIIKPMDLYSDQDTWQAVRI